MESTIAATRDFEAELKQEGHFVDSHVLHAADSAIVRRRQGRTTVEEGPFAGKRIRLGGFVLIEAEDLNQAIQLASRHPSARLGCVEVRRVQDRQ